MEWKTVKLGEVCSILGDGIHGTPVYDTKGTYFFINGNNLDNGRIVLKEDTKKVGKSEFVKHKKDLTDRTILISINGTLGNTAKYNGEPCILGKSACYINVLPEYDRDFIYYSVTNSKFKADLERMATGTTIKNVSLKSLREYELPLPSLETQRRIATILSSLDDKIENNNRINRNLEAQAQALFKSWFVDFELFGGTMPEDWKEVSLNEMTSKFGTGLNPRKNFKLGEGENYYVTIKNMGNNRVYLDDRCDKVTDEAIEKINKRSKLQAGDLLFSGIGTIGRVALVTETPTNWNTSESVFNLHPANNISSEFLYVLLLSDVFQNYVKVHAQGGVQQGIRMASLKDYKMYIPEESKMKQFDSLIIPIITRIKNIDKENDRLAALRDTLLPKLMKGEIEV